MSGESFWLPQHSRWDCIDCHKTGMTETEAQDHARETNHVSHRKVTRLT